MTDQEIEKLRDKLGSEYSVKRQNGAVTVELVDIWKGVEFADFKGSVFKIDKFDGITFYENGWSILKSDCKPSTEAAYVEQLKAKAHELYGEIYSGQAFDCSEMGLGDSPMTIKRAIFVGWNYNKKEDSLSLDGFRLYMNGKWAKKIEERVKVEVEDWKTTTNAEFKSFDFRVEMRVESSRPFDPNESAVYLSKCLKEYINKS